MKTLDKTKMNLASELIPLFVEARTIANDINGNDNLSEYHVLKALLNTDKKFQRSVFRFVLLENCFMDLLNEKISKFSLKNDEKDVSNNLKSLIMRQGSNKDEFIKHLISVKTIKYIFSESHTKLNDLLADYFSTENVIENKSNDFFGFSYANDIDDSDVKINPSELFTNLTELAKRNKLPKIVGREEELQNIYQILQRHSKCNPVVVGDAGVGKTTIIQALAQEIVKGNVPNRLKGKDVLELNLSSLMSGTQYQGSLEQKLEQMLSYIKSLNGNAIIFIDDIHNIAKGDQNKIPLSELFKPSLSRSEFPLIGATTIDKYIAIESDVSLARHFQTIDIEQPTEAETISILRGLKSKFEKHHQIEIEDNAIIQAVKMSGRYITERNFPDKAIDVIDEAASIVKISLESKPLDILNIENKLKQKRLEISSITFDGSEDSQFQMNNLNKEILILEEEEKEILEKFERDLKIANKIKQNEAEIKKLSESKTEDSLSLIKVLQEELKMLKEINFNVLSQKLTVSEVFKVVAKKTGVPLDKMKESDKEKVLKLASRLSKKLIGQNEAVSAVSRAIKRSAAGLSDLDRPTGSFLFLGSSGVGKTELCKQLAFEMFGSKDSIIRLDMSEYQEKHMITKLIGSPRGYTGAEEGGFLTNAVRKKPYSIVLFDEIEKAHPDVLNILLQVLDEGVLSDALGRKTNFKNTIVVLTSNIGSEYLDSNSPRKKAKVIKTLESKMRPELINRIDAKIVFDVLSNDNLREISKLMVQPIIEKLKEKRINLTIKDSCFDVIIKDAYEPKYGARPLKRRIEEMVDTHIADYILDGFVGKGSEIELDTSSNGRIQLYKIEEEK